MYYYYKPLQNVSFNLFIFFFFFQKVIHFLKFQIFNVFSVKNKCMYQWLNLKNYGKSTYTPKQNLSQTQTKKNKSVIYTCSKRKYVFTNVTGPFKNQFPFSTANNQVSLAKAHLAKCTSKQATLPASKMQAKKKN